MTPAQRRIHAAALKLFADKGVGEVNISDLAEAAGVARGTIYNNLQSIESLFNEVASELSSEMNERVMRSSPLDMDPAERLANGVRYYIRRAHEEPSWGKFLTRYAISSHSLRSLWAGPAVRDLADGLQKNRYDFQQEQITSVIGLISGSVLVAITLVLEGHKTWREAGSDTAELLLRALGVEKDEASTIAQMELPALAPAAHH